MTQTDEKLRHIETSQVADGVVCEVYAYTDDQTKDLGVVTVKAGYKTPLQKVISGDKTLEVYKEGKGALHITQPDGTHETYRYPGGPQTVEVQRGETMQWEATKDLVFHEVCYPPYQDGRFENITE